MRRNIFILLFTIVLISISVNAYAEQEEYDIKKEEAILTGIGILSENSSENLCTRAGFVEHILKAINQNHIYSDKEKSVFSDVESNAGQLNFAYSMGLISGDENMNFRPEETIKAGEAASIFVRVLGYNFFIKQYGDFYTTASQLGIFEKTNVSSISAPLSYEQIVLMFYNFLDCDVMEYDINGKYSTGSEAMSYFLDIYKSKGVVQADCQTDITMSSPPLGDRDVMINGDIYNRGDIDISDYIGAPVDFYYKETDNETLICYISERKHKKEVIDSEDIISVSSDFKLKYNSEKKVESIDLEDIVVIYNGRRCIDLSYEDLNIECGNLKFVDNTGDGKYDVLFITSYKTYVVKSIMQDDNTIIDYISSELINMDSFGECVITKDGSVIDISQIEQWDVLSIAQSKDLEYAKVIVNSEKIEGNNISVSKDGIRTGENSYKFSKFWKNRAGNKGFEIKNGETNKLFLDCNGKVCFCDTNLGSTKYAVMCYMYDGLDDPEYNCILVKLFDREEEMLTLELADKTKINGVNYKDEKLSKKMAEVALNTYYGVVPVVYELNNEGHIKSMLTPESEMFTVLCNDESRYYVHEANTFLKDVKYGAFCAGSSTFFCYIPENPKQYDEYTVKSLQQMGDIGQNITALSLEDSKIADFVLIRDSGGQQTVGDTENLAVVQDIFTGINEDDEVVDILTVYKDGKEVEVSSKEAGDFKDIKRGDIIFYRLNPKGKLDGIAETYHKDEFKIYSNPVNAAGRVSGKVHYKEGNVLGISIDDSNENEMGESDIIYVNLFNKPNIYVVDRKEVYTGTVDDIFDALSVGEENASQIFVQTNYTKVTNVVVYK